MALQRQVDVLRAEAGGECLCIATFLPIQRWRDVLPFLRMTSQVEKQLKATERAVTLMPSSKTQIPAACRKLRLPSRLIRCSAAGFP